MKLIVCIKQVPDPEGPRESFVINHETGKVEPQGIPPVLSLFDENALEAALRIKDKDPGNVQVTLLSLGKKVSSAVMLKALAAGAYLSLKVRSPAPGFKSAFPATAASPKRRPRGYSRPPPPSGPGSCPAAGRSSRSLRR